MPSPPSRLVCAFAFTLVSAGAGCHERSCDVDLLPGLCAAAFSSVAFRLAVVDAARLDVDGDGTAEIVAIDGARAGVAVHWGRGGVTVRPVDRVPQAIACGDFDGDGVRELALAGGGSSTVDLCRIEGDGAVTCAGQREAGQGIRDLWAGDLDDDGVDELVSADADDGTITVIHGGDGAVTRLAVGGTPVAVDLGDLDDDGILDLVAADFTGAALIVAMGQGSGGLADPRTIATAPAVQWIDLGDVDGDGHVDITARGGAVPAIWVHPGAGGGAFDAPLLVDLLPQAPIDDGLAEALTRVPAPIGVGIGVLAAEADDPGALLVPEAGELSAWRVAADRSVDGRAVLSRWGTYLDGIFEAESGAWIVGAPLFAERIDVGVGPLPVEVWRRGLGVWSLDRWGSVAIADLDGDGIVDLAVIHTVQSGWLMIERALEIFLGDGDGGFTAGAATIVDGDAEELTAVDVEGDGAPELLRAGSGGLELCTVTDGVAGAFVAVPDTQELALRFGGVLRGDDGRGRLLSGIAGVDGALARVVVTLSADAAIERVDPIFEAVLAHQAITDVDGDGDDDLVAVLDPWSESPQIQAWTAAGEAFIAGPRHDLTALTGGITSPWAIVGGDLDDDGAPEVVLMGAGEIAQIEGIEGPTPVVSPGPGVPMPLIPPTGAAAVGDIDGDGDSDLVVPGVRELLVLRREAGAWVGEAEALPLPHGVRRTLGDLDGDGVLDVVNDEGSALAVLVTRSGRGPRPTSVSPGAFGFASPVVGDLDGDGVDELVVALASRVAVIRRPRDAAPTIDALDTASAGGHEVWTLDLDHDGRDEVLLGDAVVRLGGERLRVDPLIFEGERAGWPRAGGDLDGDGATDLLVTEPVGDGVYRLSVAFGAGADRFGAPQLIDASARGSLVAADLDGDGIEDVIATDAGRTTVYWSRPGRTFGRAALAVEHALVRVDRRTLMARSGPRIEQIPIVGRAFGAPLRAAEDPRLSDAALADAGDLDGDGHRDLLSGGPEGALVWLARDDGLMLAGELSGAFGPRRAGDLDGDGLGDLVEGFGDRVWIRWGDWRL